MVAALRLGRSPKGLRVRVPPRPHMNNDRISNTIRAAGMGAVLAFTSLPVNAQKLSDDSFVIRVQDKGLLQIDAFAMQLVEDAKSAFVAREFATQAYVEAVGDGNVNQQNAALLAIRRASEAMAHAYRLFQKHTGSRLPNLAPSAQAQEIMRAVADSTSGTEKKRLVSDYIETFKTDIGKQDIRGFICGYFEEDEDVQSLPVCRAEM